MTSLHSGAPSTSNLNCKRIWSIISEKTNPMLSYVSDFRREFVTGHDIALKADSSQRSLMVTSIVSDLIGQPVIGTIDIQLECPWGTGWSAVNLLVVLKPHRLEIDFVEVGLLWIKVAITETTKESSNSILYKLLLNSPVERQIWKKIWLGSHSFEPMSRRCFRAMRGRTTSQRRIDGV